MAPRRIRALRLTLMLVLVASWLAGGSSAAQATGVSDPGVIHLSVVDSNGRVPTSVGLDVVRLEGTTWQVVDVPTCAICTPMRIGPLPAGTYRIGVSSSEKVDGRLRYLPEWLGNTHRTLYYPDDSAGTQIQVAPDGVTNAGTVVLDPPGSISGTVTDAHGQPVYGDVVARPVNFDGHQLTGHTKTDGTYRLDNAPPGPYTVILGSAGKGYVQSAWSSDGSPKGTPVPVAIGQDVTGIDAQLPDAGTVTGHVTGPDGSPVASPSVVLHWLADGVWKPAPGELFPANGDSSGAFVLKGVRPGTYRLSVSTETSPNTVDAAGEFYPHADGIEDATDVEVVADGTTTINPQLRAGGHITGRVLDSHGDPVAGAHAILYVSGEAPTGREKRATTDADGDYTFVGLAGAYRVGITGASGFQTAWVGGGAERSSAPDVDVTAAQTTEAPDVTLPDGAYLTGEVTDSSGSPLPDIHVEMVTGAGGTGGTTDADGKYRLGPVNAGTYTVNVSDPGGNYVSTSRDEALEAGQTGTYDDALVPTGNPQPLTRPAIAGDAVVDSLLSGYRGEWADRGTVTTLQWLRNGKPFAYTMGDYQVTPADVGTRLAVRVTATLDGRTTTVTTAQTPVVTKAKFTTTPKATISDRTPTYGEMLTASVAGVIPGPYSYAWRWYRDGLPISGATSASHRAAAADHGATLTVRYVPVLPGYQGVGVMSLSTGEVHRAKPAVTWSGSSPSARRLTLHITLAAPGVPASLLDGTVSINRSRSGSDLIKTVGVSNGKLDLTITGEPKGRHTYYVNFLGRGEALAPTDGAHLGITIR